MKQTATAILTAFLILGLASATAQAYEPEIMVLTPNEFSFDKRLKPEVKRVEKNLSAMFSAEMEDINEFLESAEFQLEPDNIKHMMSAQIKFMDDFDFSKWITYLASSYLSYRFYEHFENVMVIPSAAKAAGSVAELRGHADAENMQYVLNFPEVRLYKKDGESRADITVQLYDNHAQMLVFQDVFTGDPSNPGFEFACNEGSIECTVNNAMMQALYEIVYKIAFNSPTVQRQRELAGDRYRELMDNYYRPFETEFPDGIIPQSDSTIVMPDMYEWLLDPSGTKFVAFFAKEVPAHDFGSMRDNGDGFVSIISSKDIGDEGFLTDLPRMYCYIVKGVEYEGKWYYEKSKVTYFDGDSLEEGRRKYFCNLADWGFFKEGTAEPGSDFWEGSLFPKVVSAVETNRDEIEYYRALLAGSEDESDKEFYQSMIDDYYEEVEKNLEYFGLYEIVAKQLKKQTVPAE